MTKRCDIATEQGHLSISTDGYVLLYSATICYDIAVISKATRDKLVEVLNDMKFKEDINDNI